MSAWDFAGLSEIAAERRDIFDRDGFVVLGRILDEKRLDTLQTRFGAVFQGEFETGNQPDSWVWQEGTSYPHLPRHMANAWKSDLAFACYALSADLGRAGSTLMGWDAVKLAQDTLWLKPPSWPEGEFHQDRLEFLHPADGVTLWVTLDDTRPDCGTLQYIRGSHHWIRSDKQMPDNGKIPQSRKRLIAATIASDIANVDIIPLEVPAGTLVAHHSNTWHGSDANNSLNVVRRSIGIHLIPAHTRFVGRKGGYIYGRYKRIGTDELDESFFPIIWSADGRRTPTIDQYCFTGELG